MKKAFVLALLLGVLLVLYFNFTIFVVQPIGAVPEGRTLLIARQGQLRFVDSPDAMCQRIQGRVNLICRGAALGAVAKDGTIYLRMPYSEQLYLYSTGGVRYDR